MPKYITVPLFLLVPIFCRANEGQKLMPLVVEDFINKGVILFTVISLIILLIPMSDKIKFFIYTIINITVAVILFSFSIPNGDATLFLGFKILIAPLILNLIFFIKYKNVGHESQN